MPNLSTNLVASKQKSPDKIALKYDDFAQTYAELDATAARVATFLEREGIEIGDRVGIMLPNIPAFAGVFYGILRRGAVAVPMNPLLRGREVEFYLTNTSAKALFGTPDFAEPATEGARAADAKVFLVDDAGLAALIADVPEQESPVERDDLDTAVVLHTSGTTGKPKGAELTHGGLDKNREVADRTLLELTEDDVLMGCLPMFHVFGLTCGLNTTIAAGATMTFIPRFDPAKALQVIERDSVTVFEGVPTMFSALLAAASTASPDATASLRLCMSGGAALPVRVLHDFEAAFGAVILEGYGLSETSPVASFNHANRPRKPGSIGTPIEGVEMRLVDLKGDEVAPGEPGEIQIRGHNVMKGYWNLPEASAATIDADGWLASGDIARRDEDGYYFIVDRKKDLIIRGGYNVYPREIEEAVYEHPAVAEAAVIGIPHDSLGEEVGAAVVLKRDVSATADEIRNFVKERVAAYKYPRQVWFVESLPKGPTGKILRREVTPPITQKATSK